MCVLEGLEVANAVVSAFRAVDIYQDVQKTKAQNKIEIDALIDDAKTAKIQAAVERQEGIEESRRQKLSSIVNMSKEKTLFASNNITQSNSNPFARYDGTILTPAS